MIKEFYPDRLIIKIINILLRYSIGKELVRGNRSTVTGRYTKRSQEVKTTRDIPVYEYGKLAYYIQL